MHPQNRVASTSPLSSFASPASRLTSLSHAWCSYFLTWGDNAVVNALSSGTSERTFSPSPCSFRLFLCRSCPVCSVLPSLVTMLASGRCTKGDLPTWISPSLPFPVAPARPVAAPVETLISPQNTIKQPQSNQIHEIIDFLAPLSHMFNNLS